MLCRRDYSIIIKIKNYMSSWQGKTYKEVLEYCFELKKDKKVYDLTVEILKRQKLYNKMVNGNSIQKIPIINEGKMPIAFSKIFWEMIENYINPASYVGAIVKECLEKEITDVDEVTGIVGRGLRALAAFFRELDLAHKLSDYFPDAEILSEPQSDVKDHTDILIRNDDLEYRFWSYQSTEKGLNNTAERFCGKRGKLPDSHHVICPIDIYNSDEVEKVHGWYFYSENHVEDIYGVVCNEKNDDYNVITKRSPNEIKDYLKKTNIIHKKE